MTTTLSEGTTCCLPTLTVPDPFLRAWIIFESVEAHGTTVTLTFAVCQQATSPQDHRAPQFRSLPYRSIRIQLPAAQALSLQATLMETLCAISHP